jgi:hypothetical protein
VFDPKVGGNKLSTMVLNPSSGPNGGLSVDLQKEIEEANIGVEQFVMNPPWIGAIRYEAGQFRDEDLKVGFDPLPENPYHGEVWGSFTRSKQKKLLELAEWFVQLDGVVLNVGK